MNKITILLADDHIIVREGLRNLLAAEPGFSVIGQAGTGRKAVTMSKELKPMVVIMDIAMPELNGLEAARQIIDALPSTRVVMLSAYGDDEYIEKVAAVGAAGYLIKQSSSDILSKAVREVCKGNMFFGPPVAKRLKELYQKTPKPLNKKTLLKQPSIQLTPRETEVLQLIAEGNANKQTAESLGISIKTVEKHRQNLMTKLNIHDTAGLTRYAISARIIESSVQVIIT